MWVSLFLIWKLLILCCFLSHNLVEFITINKKQFNTKEVYVVIRNLWSNELITTSMHIQGNLKSKWLSEKLYPRQPIQSLYKS